MPNTAVLFLEWLLLAVCDGVVWLWTMACRLARRGLSRV